MTQRVSTLELPGGARLPLHVHLQPDSVTEPDLSDDAAAREAFAAGRWRYVTVSVVVEIDGTTIDLDARRRRVPFGDLPSGSIDIEHLLHADPVPSLIAAYQEGLARLAVRLAGLGLATADAVPIALRTDDLTFLLNCLAITARRWQDVIDETEAGARRPQRSRPAEPGHVNVEPTRSGYRTAAEIFRVELRRVQQLTDRLTRLADLADGNIEDEDEP
jgi:hypothetical protein